MKSSRGDTDMMVVIIVLIGAFLLIGGQFLMQGLGSIFPSPYPEPSITPPPGNGNQPGNGGGNNGNGNQSALSIEIVNGQGTCDNNQHLYNVGIAFHSPSDGFYQIQVQNNGSYSPVYIDNNIFNTVTINGQNPQVSSLTLANSDGFSANPWKIILYQGGTVTGNNITGTTAQVEKDFKTGTGCQ